MSCYPGNWFQLSGDERVARVEAWRAGRAGFSDETASLRRALSDFNARARVRRRCIAYIAAKRGTA